MCVDLIGPYTIKTKDKTVLAFMRLTVMNPAISWSEIVEVSTTEVQVMHNGKYIIKIVIDKSSACIARLFNNQSGFELVLNHFANKYHSNVSHTSSRIHKIKGNAILEQVHAVCSNMCRTFCLDMQDTRTPEIINELVANISWRICATYHTLIGSSPCTVEET